MVHIDSLSDGHSSQAFSLMEAAVVLLASSIFIFLWHREVSNWLLITAKATAAALIIALITSSAATGSRVGSLLTLSNKTFLGFCLLFPTVSGDCQYATPVAPHLQWNPTVPFTVDFGNLRQLMNEYNVCFMGMEPKIVRQGGE